MTNFKSSKVTFPVCDTSISSSKNLSLLFRIETSVRILFLFSHVLLNRITKEREKERERVKKKKKIVWNNA